MKASILALTISTALSTHAFASSTKVDIQAANAATHELIDQQMRDIDASVQAQLVTKYADAQPGDIAVIDDVVYEQQSNGTWAAVGTASAVLVAGLLSSSSSGGNSTEDLPDIPVNSNPIEAQPDNDLPQLDSPVRPIEVSPSNPNSRVGITESPNGDKTIFVDGEQIAYVSLERGDIRNNDNEVIATFDKKGNKLVLTGANDNTLQYNPNTKNVRINGEVVGKWSPEYGFVKGGDIGQGPEGQPMHPDFIDGDFEMTPPIAHLPVFDSPVNPIEVSPSSPNARVGITESPNGDKTIFVDGEQIAYISLERGDIRNNDNEVIATFDKKGNKLVLTGANDNTLQYNPNTKNVRINGEVVGKWSPEYGFVKGGDIGQGPEGQPINPIEVSPSSPNARVGITESPNGDKTIFVDGEQIAYVSLERGDIRNNDNEVIATFEKNGKKLVLTGTNDNTLQYNPNTKNVRINGEVVGKWSPEYGFIKGGDIGQGPEGQPMNPDFIDGDFEMTPPIDHLPEFDGDNDYDNTHIQIADYRGNGEAILVVNGEEVADIEYKDGTLIINKYDSTQGHKYSAKVQETPNGAVVAVRHNDDSGYSFFRINDNGVVTPVDKKSAQNAIQNIDRSKMQNIDQNKLNQVKAKVQNRLSALKK
ncbi:hypothetical protein [Vibrio superstes]|uniref:Uncharacterized protein n=1 Tax=Vibrio superstes NBRC 103154 TaxID=1219062 RepID=A0A511QS05_9VIBR|nr:hypothetical protein [Vibrio superstes]GEM80139.1 hypothetical protein VSU01S_23840 [Vibrio superstes NBRC 103154]